jgi:hypothetical protein
MGKAKILSYIGGAGLCLAVQSLCLHAQDGPGAENNATAEKSLLPKAVRSSSATDKKAPEFCQCVGDSESAAVERIEQALRAPLHSNGLDFVDTPLGDVVQSLSADYRIPIQLDKSALDEVGVGPDQHVSITIHDISLRSAMRLMLHSLQLTYLIRDEVLIVTTPDAAEKDLAVCAYNVSGMLGAQGSDLESVAEMIRSCVSADTWAKNGGGQAEIRTIKPDLLVISQTSAVHEEIRDLLSAIRKVHGQGGASPAATNKSAEGKHDEVVTRSYVLQMNPTNEASTLRAQVRELIVNALPDETWVGRLADGQSVLLSVFHDRIVVRQTPAVQEKVERILADSGIASPTPPPNGPGMVVPGAGGFAPGLGGPEGADPAAAGSPFGGIRPGAGFAPGEFGPGGAAGFAPSPAPNAGE